MCLMYQTCRRRPIVGRWKRLEELLKSFWKSFWKSVLDVFWMFGSSFGMFGSDDDGREVSRCSRMLREPVDVDVDVDVECGCGAACCCSWSCSQLQTIGAIW